MAMEGPTPHSACFLILLAFLRQDHTTPRSSSTQYVTEIVQSDAQLIKQVARGSLGDGGGKEQLELKGLAAEEPAVCSVVQTTGCKQYMELKRARHEQAKRLNPHFYNPPESPSPLLQVPTYPCTSFPFLPSLVSACTCCLAPPIPLSSAWHPLRIKFLRSPR